MNSPQTNTNGLADPKINVKIILSALWITVMLLYIYGDIFSFFVPGHIESLNSGKMGIGTTTPLKLLAASILMTIPSVMVFLSLALRPTLNRLLNIIFGTVYTVIIVLTTLSAIELWMTFYIFLGIAEIIITSIIAWYAWKWPRQ